MVTLTKLGTKSLLLVPFILLMVVGTASGLCFGRFISEQRASTRRVQGGFVVGNDKYYYNGVYFYVGKTTDVTAAVEAPEGAVVKDLPSGYETVEVDGTPYRRYHDVYYRPEGHGYRVVRMNRPEEHHDEHGDEHHDEH